MIELALRDEAIAPFVERLPGPIVRLNLSASDDLLVALTQCGSDLMLALEWALTAVYSDDEAPSRVFIRNANGLETVAMVDPCLTYGSEAIIRP